MVSQPSQNHYHLLTIGSGLPFALRSVLCLLSGLPNPQILSLALDINAEQIYKYDAAFDVTTLTIHARILINIE